MRRQGLWTYFLSLILVIGMTVALLPACGGGGGESCNSDKNQVDGNEALCDLEETEEEFDADSEEARDELAEDGVDNQFEEDNFLEAEQNFELNTP